MLKINAVTKDIEDLAKLVEKQATGYPNYKEYLRKNGIDSTMVRF